MRAHPSLVSSLVDILDMLHSVNSIGHFLLADAIPSTKGLQLKYTSLFETPQH